MPLWGRRLRRARDVFPARASCTGGRFGPRHCRLGALQPGQAHPPMARAKCCQSVYHATWERKTAADRCMRPRASSVHRPRGAGWLRPPNHTLRHTRRARSAGEASPRRQRSRSNRWRATMPSFSRSCVARSSRASLCTRSLRSAISFLRSSNVVEDVEPACSGSEGSFAIWLHPLHSPGISGHRGNARAQHSAVELPPQSTGADRPRSARERSGRRSAERAGRGAHALPAARKKYGTILPQHGVEYQG